MWLEPLENFPHLPGHIEKSIKRLGRFPKHMKYICIKTWSNGWTTAHRAKQTQMPCVLCQQGRDSQTHYIECPSLWTPILAALELPPDINGKPNLTFDDNDSLIDRRFGALYAAYHLYNALRQSPGNNTDAHIKGTIKTKFESQKLGLETN